MTTEYRIITTILSISFTAILGYTIYEIIGKIVENEFQKTKSYSGEDSFKEDFTTKSLTPFQISNPPEDISIKPKSTYNEYDHQKYKKAVFKTLNSRVEPIINSKENPYLKMRGHKE